MKKVVATLLAALMVLCILPTAAFAEGNDNSVPVWPEEGSIHLEKSAEKANITGFNDAWEITLKVSGKNYKTTSDVVLVIDNSNSMYEDGRMTKTKTAAKAFVDKLLTEDSSTRIAVVVFNLKVTNTGFYTYQNKEEIKQYIDNIKKNEDDGGTFTQLGIKTAQELLTSAESTGKNKSIVLLSDGVPTKSYEVNNISLVDVTGASPDITSNCSFGTHSTPTIKLKPEYTTKIEGCDYSKTKGNGYENDYGISYTVSASSQSFFNHDEVKGSWKCSHALGSSKTWNYVINANNSNGTQNTTGTISGHSNGTINFSTKFTAQRTIPNLSEPTIWEANQAKNAGTTIYSVALQAGTNGENTLKACASDPIKGYFAIGKNETDVAGKLTEAFTAIAGSIAIAAKNGVVNDQMSEFVDVYFDNAQGAPIITDDLSAYNAGNADIYISQGTATFEREPEKIIWQVGNVNEDDPPIMKYRVIAKQKNYEPGQLIPTNEFATFDYTDYKDEEQQGTFPVPQVAINGGTILVHYYLVNGDGKPINESGVEVESPKFAKQVKEEHYFVNAEGQSGLSYGTYTVNKADIEGHNYFGKYSVDERALVPGAAAAVELSTANANRHVWFAYNKEFTVVHVKENGSTSENFSVSAGFDMTAHVTEGYLYGGTFSDEACTQVANFGGGNPTSFLPEAGKTYYIWEVDKAYLMPKSLSCWEHVDATNVDVTGFYLVTPIDRLNYSEVGFKVGGAKLPANQLTEEYMQNGEKATLIKDGEQSVVYDKIVVDCKSARTETFDITSITNKTKGYLACYSMDKATYWNEAGATVTFTPYWITLDGVEVTGSATRTCEYKGAGSDADTTYKKVGKVSEVAAAVEPVFTSADNANGLTLLSAFIADGVQMNPVAPTEPEKPIEPTESEQPTEPEQPIEPTEPEQPEKPEQPSNEINVTVHDAGETYTVTVAKGDIRGEIEHIGADDKLFAGWYYDEHCKKVADLADITEDTEIHAKYVSTSYLQVKYIENFFFRNRGIYLISAVDGRDFAETGFIINGEAFTASGSNRNVHYSASYLFGRDVSRNARLIVEDYSLYGVEEGTELVVAPYWVTADGTTVYGTERVLTVGRYGIEG